MRHFDLLTEIGLLVIFWLFAVLLGPIGFVRLFPIKEEQRQLVSGLSLVAIGIVGFALIGVLLLLG